jgi:hypothetical protein
MGVFQNEKNEQEEKSRIRTFKSSFGIYCDWMKQHATFLNWTRWTIFPLSQEEVDEEAPSLFDSFLIKIGMKVFLELMVW